jgi:peptide/nickel transport system substrate-binding protein
MARRFLVVGIFLAFLLGSSASSLGASSEPRRGGTLTMGIQRDVVSMHPMQGTASTEQAIRELMFETVTGLDAEDQVQPNLAESWAISSDGRVYTFRIRKGVRFHNGQELTADDVKYSIDYTMDAKNGAYGYETLSIISRADTLDKHTLRVTLKKPSPAFISALADMQSFPVVPKGSLPEGAEKIKTFPPGTGPFKFSEWKPRERIVFERNDQYWGHKPYVDRLVLRPISNETVRFTALRSGDLDLVERVPYEWVRQVREGKLKGIGVAEAPGASWRRLLFNVADPPFNDKKLRQAVAHAMNKNEIGVAAYFGFGRPTDQRYPAGHAWYIKGVPAANYNMDRARKLLEESGFVGKTVKILVEQSQVREAEAQALQSQLKKIGLNVEIETVDRGAFLTRQRRGDFEFMTEGGAYFPDPWPTYAPPYACAGDPRKRAGNNRSGYCDKEIDAWLDQLEVEHDRAKRRKLLEQILVKLSDDLPEIPIATVSRFFAFRDHVKGFTTDREGRYLWAGGGVTRVWLEK